MNDYELVCVFSVKENFYAKGTAAVKEKLAAMGAQLEREEDMGERSLAYFIKKQGLGHYHLFVFKSDGKNLDKFEDQLKLQAGLLRCLMVRKAQPSKRASARKAHKKHAEAARAE